MDTSYVIGIDIGGTYFRIGAVNTQYEISFLKKCPVRDIFTTDVPLADLERYLKEYLAESALTGKVTAIVIGFPATLNRERTMVLQAPNIRFMERLPVVEWLTAALGIRVLIERDVCLTVLYDIRKYHIPMCEILIGCYFGTGVGNAVCLDHRPLIGSHGTAGELGHIPVLRDREACGCGNRGCMENLAGGKYLAKLCRDVYRDTDISDLFRLHGKEKPLLKFVDAMAVAVATEINILDPDYILIGGGVPNMKNFPRGLLEQRIREHTRKPYPEQDLHLIFTEDEQTKTILGSAYYVEMNR